LLRVLKEWLMKADSNRAMMILLAGSTNVVYMSYNRKETDRVKKGLEISRCCHVWEIANPACMMMHAHEERSDAQKSKAQYLANCY
jgi:hypothetical protein